MCLPTIKHIDGLTCRGRNRRIQSPLYRDCQKQTLSADHEAHIRVDLLHPQRVTSRWVGKARNTWDDPNTCSVSADVVGDHRRSCSAEK
ncbi:hypothetical protein EMIT0P2_70309 [Pseudomonas sp. IT-P2]